jgi:hypothetical protein
MKRKLGFATALAAVVALASIIGVYAFAGGGKDTLRADVLSGYQEATSPSVASDATGTFTATIDDATQTISFEETYSGLSSPATQSHIHFGNRYNSGGVSAFLCGGSTKPPCPPGTTTPADITGTITPADVIGPVSQGINPGDWQKLVDAMRAGVTYANVHSQKFPAGEIRGQINNEDQREPATFGPNPGQGSGGDGSDGSGGGH